MGYYSEFLQPWAVACEMSSSSHFPLPLTFSPSWLHSIYHSNRKLNRAVTQTLAWIPSLLTACLVSFQTPILCHPEHLEKVYVLWPQLELFRATEECYLRRPARSPVGLTLALGCQGARALISHSANFCFLLPLSLNIHYHTGDNSQLSSLSRPADTLSD